MELVLQRAAAAVPLVLVPALGLAQGGYLPGAWVWAGTLAAWGCALALVLSPDPGAFRRGWPWTLFGAGLLAWTALSALWSANPAQSVLEARRTLLYVVVVLALLLLARRGASRLIVPATHVAVTALVAYALARYLLEPRRDDPFEGYLLSAPLGYANAVGILAALGLLLALGLAAGEADRRTRIAAAASAPVLALALDLTGSTASWLALGVGIALIATLTPALPRLLATLALLAPPAAVAAAVGSYSRLADVVTEPRLSGPVVAAVGVACAAAAGGAVALVRLPGPNAGSRTARRLVLAGVVVLALGGAAAVARSGATEPRASYYHVAWHDQVLAHPLLGTGAGTFGHYWALSGKEATLAGALDAHSLYLETLAELGPVGLLLLLAVLLAPLRALSARRHVPHVATAVGAYAAFLVHAGLDWDWEIPAVVVAALCCAAAAATADLRAERRALGGRARAALLAATLGLGACALAGVRSGTVPAAAPDTTKAPPRGAFVETRV